MELTKEERNMIHKYLAAKYKEFISVYTAVMEQKGFINDHTNEWEAHEDYVVLWQGNGREVCPIYPKSVCCLNPLYLAEDGKLHLSTTSVGGNVEYGDVNRHNYVHGIFNKVHRLASYEIAEKFSTNETEENMPW